jgi:hypothetical protein
MANNQQFTNNAATTLSAGINASVTTITLSSGTGALFPALSGSQYFYGTLSNLAGTVNEIVKVTARSTDTLTVVRAQEGTTASSFLSGDNFQLRATAAAFNNVGQLDSSNTWSQTQTMNISGTATNIASGTVGAVPYQSTTSTTVFLTGNTTTTPQFVTSTGTGSAAQAPTLTSSTGSGNVVLSNSPTLVTPALGTPASGVASNMTVDGTDSVGYRNVPINSQSAAYTAVLTDSGKVIFHPSTDANARTFTIPANASVVYPLGTVLTFINMTSQVVTLSITSDTMYLVGTGSTGSRSLAQYGMATAIKMTSTTWLISGSGLS